MSSTTHTRPPGSGSRQGESGEEGRAELPSLAPWEPPVHPAPAREGPLPVLRSVEEARAAATEAERAGVAARINQQLDGLEAGGEGRRVADVLHQLLEGGGLEGLADATGRTCRAAATEALLRLGFPFALEVRPEDLEHLRGRDADGQGWPWLSPLAGGLQGAGVLAQGLALPEGLSPGMWLPLLALMGLSLLALVPALLAPERSDAKRAGLLGLLVLGLIQVFLGTFGDYYGTLSGSAGLLAWLLLVLPRR